MPSRVYLPYKTETIHDGSTREHFYAAFSSHLKAVEFLRKLDPTCGPFGILDFTMDEEPAEDSDMYDASRYNDV